MVRALLLSVLSAGLLLGASAQACGREINPLLYQQALEAALRHQIPPHIAVALFWVESRFCPQAQGGKGEIGLGQILPSTAQSLGINPEHLWDPKNNINASLFYLRKLYDLLGTWELALAGYNAGPQRASNPPPSTRVYVWRVMYVASQIQAQVLKDAERLRHSLPR